MFLKKFVPAISIIIPMYNVEKYIGELLDSILVQTFQNFEVIVVDNCSTDKSCDVVESYIPKFHLGGGDRIRLIRNKKNSGSGAVSSNVGMKFAIGEYIFFVDSDDALTETALEELYTAAKNFQADVVHFQKFYTIPENAKATDKNIPKGINSENREIFYTPHFESDNLAERLKAFSEAKIFWAPWCQLIKRDLILKFNIKFPPLIISYDFVFSFFVLCSAEKYLLYSSPVYIYRVRDTSLTHREKTLEEVMHSRAGDLFTGINYLDEFMNNSEFFKKHPTFRYDIFDIFAINCGLEPTMLEACKKFNVVRVGELLQKELKKNENLTVLTEYLFLKLSVTTFRLAEQLKNIQ